MKCGPAGSSEGKIKDGSTVRVIRCSVFTDHLLPPMECTGQARFSSGLQLIPYLLLCVTVRCRVLPIYDNDMYNTNCYGVVE